MKATMMLITSVMIEQLLHMVRRARGRTLTRRLPRRVAVLRVRARAMLHEARAIKAAAL